MRGFRNVWVCVCVDFVMCGSFDTYVGVLVIRVLSILQTGRITLSSTPDPLLEKPQHEIPQAATTI
jgi:hypothetical protein